jgi:protein required for attachment to host cells
LNRGTFIQLVLVAQPRPPGDLRESLSAKARATLVGDLNKDLMALSTSDLASRLRDIVNV